MPEASPKSILVIQTAFIGDVILATAVLEKLHRVYPDTNIDLLVRKGNEGLFKNHPYLHQVLAWNKKSGKLKNLWKLTAQVRATRYEYVINLHRYASTGIVTAFSKAKHKIGFDKNPLSFLFTHRVKHTLVSGAHETERNQELIKALTDNVPAMPRLYPARSDFDVVNVYMGCRYVCMAPSSVWFTKQWPADKWIELIQTIQHRVEKIYLLGAPTDVQMCQAIAEKGGVARVENLAGKLTLLQSAALIGGAVMNYVNDSAPMHLASAMNAPVAAIYCSTIPAFGFGPLSKQSYIIQTEEDLSCRPCGSHGHKACPQKHFRCATSISIEALQSCLTSQADNSISHATPT
ncbi:MAG: glycosyltransferase family 9 protein [Cyclobacteriaceae bacterium]|nr:glycosyltransferase family 9 protein [Cyclobacteriaceae bacterium]